MAEEEREQQTSSEDKEPGHHAAAAVAGMQFLVGIAITFAILIPGAFIWFVLIPMGWGAIGPLAIIAVVLACLIYVGRIIMRSQSDPPR